MKHVGWKRKPQKDIDALNCCLAAIRFVPGAVPYQGADDVTYVLYALILALRIADQKGIDFGRIAAEWSRLLEKNADFMKAMQIENAEVFDNAF